MILFIIWLFFIGGIKPVPYPPTGNDPPPKIANFNGSQRESVRTIYGSPTPDAMD